MNGKQFPRWLNWAFSLMISLASCIGNYLFCYLNEKKSNFHSNLRPRCETACTEQANLCYMWLNKIILFSVSQSVIIKSYRRRERKRPMQAKWKSRGPVMSKWTLLKLDCCSMTLWNELDDHSPFPSRPAVYITKTTNTIETNWCPYLQSQRNGHDFNRYSICTMFSSLWYFQGYG